MKIRRVLCWLLSLALLTGSIYTADTLVRQRRLARKTVRLHVIANSDEAADQAQKLRVRDGVLYYKVTSNPLPRRCAEKSEAKRS